MPDEFGKPSGIRAGGIVHGPLPGNRPWLAGQPCVHGTPAEGGPLHSAPQTPAWAADRQHSGLVCGTPGKAPWAPGPRGLCKGGLAAPCSHPEPETPLRSDTWEPPSNLYYHVHRQGRWSRTVVQAWQVQSRTQTHAAKSAMPPDTYSPPPVSPHREHQATR